MRDFFHQGIVYNDIIHQTRTIVLNARDSSYAIGDHMKEWSMGPPQARAVARSRPREWSRKVSAAKCRRGTCSHTWLDLTDHAILFWQVFFFLARICYENLPGFSRKFDICICREIPGNVESAERKSKIWKWKHWLGRSWVSRSLLLDGTTDFFR